MSSFTGAQLVRHALEQLPVSHTFGIPGVHTTELYDELGRSRKIRPVLVTHEAGGAFAADAMSRTGAGRIGCLIVVPAAGLTHAMSGIGECHLGGIPLLVICGGVRTDVPYGFQLHEVDQGRLVGEVVKRAWRVLCHGEIVPAIFEAYRAAIAGVPGPVLVEIPANIQLTKARVADLPLFDAAPETPADVENGTAEAVGLLAEASSPGIFVGWGAVDVSDAVARIAEILGAPVSTTLQGLSAFPGNHPLHAGMGFSRAAVPAAENAFRDCDCLLAVGTSFAEIPTGSFGCRVPANLVHIDMSRAAIGRNFAARVAIVADSRVAVPRLLDRLQAAGIDRTARRDRVEQRIRADKRDYRDEWRSHRGDRVNPALFFSELRSRLPDAAIVAVDDGNHTYLAAELFEARQPRTVILPTDFNSMGYAVPASVGAKLANPGRDVVAIVGDGGFLMTGLELITAVTLHLGIACFVFHDGELSQISQGQEISYNRKTCTVLGDLRLRAIAEAIGARYISIENNNGIGVGIEQALANAAHDQPSIVDVRIDYSRRTRFTKGVVSTVFKRFPLKDKLRIAGRALARKMTG